MTRAIALGASFALLAILLAAPTRAAIVDYIEVICPASGHNFYGMAISGVNTAKHRDGDFLLRAEGGNHLETKVWTCPYCFFSAYPDIFLAEDRIDFDPASMEKVELTDAAKEEETVQSLIPCRVKYGNAAVYYASVGKPPYFMGVLYLQGSWAARLSKVSMPADLVSLWQRVHLQIIRGHEDQSEEKELEATAEAFRAELQAAKSQPQRDNLECAMGSALRQAGQHRRAIPYLRRLASEATSGALANAASAELELARTEIYFQEQALRYFTEAVKFKETLPDDRLHSIYLVGELNRRLGNLDQAKKWFERASEEPMPQLWARSILERQKRKLMEEIATH